MAWTLRELGRLSVRGLFVLAFSWHALARADEARAADSRVAAHSPNTDATEEGSVRLEIERLEARESYLVSHRKRPSLLWPSLGAVVGFSLATGFTATGAAQLAWENQSERRRLMEVDDPGGGASRVIATAFVVVGAISFVAGVLCAAKVRRLKRGRFERERELTAIGHRLDQLHRE